MPLYLFSTQFHDSSTYQRAREAIVEAAVFSLPITVTGLLTFAGRA